MGHVGERVLQLPIGQRPLRPIGEARALVDAGIGELARQGLVAHRIAEAADHRSDLGVEQRRRHLAGEMEEDFDVLARGVEDLGDIGIRHQLEQRRQIDARRQRIDGHGFLGPGDLHQAELRPIGLVAHELGVDGDELMPALAAAELGQCGGLGDEGHWACYTRISGSLQPALGVRRPSRRG